MNRPAWTTLFATALAFVMTLPAAAVQAPKQAIGEDTAAVVWVDLQQITPEMIDSIGASLAGLGENAGLEEIGGALPLGDIQDMVKQMTGFRNGFVQAGGSGMLMTLEMPKEESWSPPMSILAKSQGKVDAAAMGDLMREMSDGVVQQAQCNALEEGWHEVSLTGLEGKAVTHALPAPNEAAFKAFNRQLGEDGKPVVRIALRVQDAIKSMAGGLKDGVDQAGDPNVAMLGALIEPLKALDTIGISVSQIKGKGDNVDMEVDVQLVFLDADSAMMFNNFYNMILLFAPAQVVQQFQNVPGAPDAVEINNFFMKLKMTHDADTLRLKLDQEFFDMADEMRKKMQPAPAPPRDQGDVPI